METDPALPVVTTTSGLQPFVNRARTLTYTTPLREKCMELEARLAALESTLENEGHEAMVADTIRDEITALSVQLLQLVFAVPHVVQQQLQGVFASFSGPYMQGVTGGPYTQVQPSSSSAPTQPMHAPHVAQGAPLTPIAPPVDVSTQVPYQDDAPADAVPYPPPPLSPMHLDTSSAPIAPAKSSTPKLPSYRMTV